MSVFFITECEVDILIWGFFCAKNNFFFTVKLGYYVPSGEMKKGERKNQTANKKKRKKKKGLSWPAICEIHTLLFCTFDPGPPAVALSHSPMSLNVSEFSTLC